MTKEDLDRMISTMDADDVEQFLFDFISAIMIIENKTFQEVIDKYHVEFSEKYEDLEVKEKQIKLIYQMHEIIMKDR